MDQFIKGMVFKFYNRIPSDSLPDALLPQKISPHKSWKWHGPIEPVVHPIEPVDFEDADEDAGRTLVIRSTICQFTTRKLGREN